MDELLLALDKSACPEWSSVLNDIVDNRPKVMEIMRLFIDNHDSVRMFVDTQQNEMLQWVAHPVNTSQIAFSETFVFTESLLRQMAGWSAGCKSPELKDICAASSEYLDTKFGVHHLVFIMQQKKVVKTAMLMSLQFWAGRFRQQGMMVVAPVGVRP